MNRFTLQPGWRLLLLDMGITPEKLLRRAGLPEELLVRQEMALPAEEYYRLWEALDAETQEQALAPRLLARLSVEMFDPLLFAALCSPNLVVAARRIRQFKPLIGPLRLDLDETGGGLNLTVHFPPAVHTVPPALIASELGFFARVAYLATRHRVRPERMITPVPWPDVASHAAFFGVAPEIGKAARVRFSPADAHRPFVTENDAMWRTFEPRLRQRLARLAATATMSERVRAALLELIPSGLTGAGQVARRLAVSKRTLQRRLHEEGNAFSGVLAQVRRELAEHYLHQSDLPYSQIAFLLGYDDPNSFYRAFHGWTGITPHTARAAAPGRAMLGGSGYRSPCLPPMEK
jgi:AraC-like DNA-binding protein